MSFTPIKGTDGAVKHGATPTVVTRCRSWSFKSERTTEKLPPHIGDPDEVTVSTGKSGSLDLEFTIPSGRDAGQTAITDSYEDGTTEQLVLEINSGYTITFAAPAYTALEITVDAAGTPIMKVSVEGAYTLANDT